MLQIKQWINFTNVRDAKQLMEDYEDCGALTRWWTTPHEITGKTTIVVEVVTDEGCLGQADLSGK